MSYDTIIKLTTDEHRFVDEAIEAIFFKDFRICVHLWLSFSPYERKKEPQIKVAINFNYLAGIDII